MIRALVCAEWRRTHDVAGKTAIAVTAMLKNGATCLGKTVMDELGFGITGENAYYGTPINPKLPSLLSGGSSSGSVVAVASELVDFALGTDTCGCIRIPAAFCGISGYKPSHGIVSMVGVLPNSQSLDTVVQPSIFRPVHVEDKGGEALDQPELRRISLRRNWLILPPFTIGVLLAMLYVMSWP